MLEPMVFNLFNLLYLVFLDVSTSELVKLVSENSRELTLEWVLSVIQLEIEKHQNQTILVDAVPNMQFLFKAQSFIKNCTNEMSAFEKKVGIDCHP